MSQKHEQLLIIDFGSQVTQLIARRVRESGIYCEVHPYNKINKDMLTKYAPKAVILSGGPSSVMGTSSPRIDDNVFDLGVPILGHLLRTTIALLTAWRCC